MTVGNVYFAVFALVCLVGAIATIASKNPIRSAVGLLATIVGIAALFLKLHAQFLAAIQLIVYAGAVVVLFVFVIMLLGPDAGLTTRVPGHAKFARLVSSAGILVLAGLSVLLLLPKGESKPTVLAAPRVDHGSTEAVGGLIFSRGIVPFELATALLIVAVIGAIAVARTRHTKKRAAHADHETRRLFHGPLHPRDAEHPLKKEPAK
jgi:NADH-quinone oxidoreductase subunit J